MKDLETSVKTESQDFRVADLDKQDLGKDDESLEREAESNNLENIIEDVLDGKALFGNNEAS